MKFNSLPLSWTLSDTIPAIRLTLKLPFGKCKWVYYSNFKAAPADIAYLNQSGYCQFIRGLSDKHLAGLQNHESLYIGREAVLKLNFTHFEKKSLKELVRRGKRNGFTEEIEYSPEGINLLDQIKKSCSHSKEPQLRYLFSDNFSKNERFFVFRNKNTIWGAVVTSVNGKNKVHTELLLRREDAPVGIMEALIHDTYTILSSEGQFKYFSLGEVPFIYSSSRLGLKNRLLLKLGRFLKFIYNYEGLYLFKNKFNPDWHDLYIAETNRIKITTLFGIVVKSNLLKLTLFKLKRLLIFRS